MLIAGLVASILTASCESDSRPMTIADYRPASVLREKKAPDSEVFVLWRWYPIAPVTTQPVDPKVVLKQHPVEVVQVFAPRGAPIGFRQQAGQLIAVAGSATRPLEQAHYTWETLPGTNQRIENQTMSVETAAYGPVADQDDQLRGLLLIPLIPLELAGWFLDQWFDQDNCDEDAGAPSSLGGEHHHSHLGHHHPPASRPST